MAKKDKLKAAQPVVAESAGGVDEGALRDETLALIRELGITQAAAALDSDGDDAPTPTAAAKSAKKADKVVKPAEEAKKDTSKPKLAAAGTGAAKAKVAPASAAATTAGANGSAAKPQANGKVAKAAAKPKQTATLTNGSAANKPAAARQQPAKAAAPLAPAVPLTMRHPGCELSDEGGGWFDMVPATLTPPSGSLNGKQKKKMKKQEAAAAAAVVAAVAAGGSLTAAPAATAAAAQRTGALYQPAPAEVIRRHREAAAVLLAKEVDAWEKQREKRQSGDDRYLSQVRAAVLPCTLTSIATDAQ
jgi:hypothetical protein